MLQLSNEEMIRRANEVFLAFQSEQLSRPISIRTSGLDVFNNGRVLFLSFSQKSLMSLRSLREDLRLHFLHHLPQALFCDRGQKEDPSSFTPHLTVAKMPHDESSGGKRVVNRYIPAMVVADLSRRLQLEIEIVIRNVHLCTMGWPSEMKIDPDIDRTYYHTEADLSFGCD